MPPVRYQDKIHIVSLSGNGLSSGQIAAQLGIPRSTVQFYIRRWMEQHSIVRRNLLGSRRPRVSTMDEDQILADVVRDGPFCSAAAARIASNHPGSVRTALRRLRGTELRNFAAVQKPRLQEFHKEARIGFALQYLACGPEFWRKVVFSDEKVFQSSQNGRLRVYRPRNTRYSPRYVQQIDNSGRFSVNLWAWISADSPGVMVQIEERLNQHVYIRILEEAMIPSIQRVYPNGDYIFQQDNCSVHTGHIVREWLEAQNIVVLPWPSRSPDLNPIENLWGLLTKQLSLQRRIYRNREELLAAITDAWHSLPQGYNTNLCLSRPRRIRAVLDANGEVTKY